ncbi:MULTISPECIES: lytic transglycosylase domain-containing protein [unclassified Flavobacterium]|uniref:lytic transglycosylase domain-containing protein n=1 Tax=unclassified Flavobacterium TaxID=196869 RepID=UPI00086D3B82|nr:MULTISPECIES: lytic transglycosylase domain-containing protein [unclassified Flavobacterium]MBN9283130.1 lytic transglycosylase domain-containing protein [Flavobacterium sp.]ODS86634.1 MAG: murein transglycosylase [Chryseobacterium sp. SCN 40-13]OJV67757.1 MAG: murein transglycosylase [Flavobacterium sp. 40-81]
MNRIKRTAIVAAVIITSGVLIHWTSTGTGTEVDVKNHVYLPANIDFAGEQVPMSLSDVKERLDRELLVNVNLHATTALVIKRANRAFPVIEPILKQYGVPDDFKYLAVIESGLVNAVSSAGARGVWQFMPETAKEKGMEVNEYVDERYHLEKSTEAACKYLLSAKDKFGNWTLAAASYNGGMNGVNKQIESQKVTDYYDLLLNDETSRYVFRILALKEIMKNQVKYGYDLPKEVLYQQIPVKKVEVTATIDDLALFAIEQGINYKILKIHNPWLRDKKLVVAPNKKYTIDIPLEGYKR